jgi:hypothetical protein
MKKYLLLTTAFFSFASISYASDDQEDARPSSSQPRATPQEEIQAIIKKYAPDNLARGAFNDLKSADIAVVQGRQYGIPLTKDLEANLEVKKTFRENLPNSLPTNGVRTLSVVSTTHDLETMKVYIIYKYFGAWGFGTPTEYQFMIETVLEAPDYARLLALKTPPKLSSSASYDSLSTDTGYESDEEVQKLKAVIAKLTEENARLLQSSMSASAAAAPSDEFAPPPPPPFLAPPPPPPAPGSSGISRAKAPKVVILSSVYQPIYEDLEATVKQMVSTWNQTRIELYLTLRIKEKMEEAATFFSLNEAQAQKVLKMSYPDQIAYLQLDAGARQKKDDEDAAKAQRAADVAAQKGDLFAQILKAKTPIMPYESEVKKEEESTSIDSSTPSFAQALQLTISVQEKQAFDNAKRLWNGVSQPRKTQILSFFSNDIILKGILLKTINGEIVTLDSNKKGQYTAPTILKAGLSLLRQQKEISQDLRFTAKDIRDLSVYALLNAKAIGINATHILPIIEDLRKLTF